MTNEETAVYNRALQRIRSCYVSGEKELDLSGLGLTHIPPEIGQLTELSLVDLSKNHLLVLPPEIGNITAITELRLDYNHLSTLPSEISQLTRLRWLAIQHNQLSILPREIGSLSALRRLDLTGNQLSEVPPEIGQLTELLRLDLSGNQLSSLPQEIGKLAALTQLDLDENQLSSLPPSLGDLERLQVLYLHGNEGLGLSTEVLGPTWIDVQNKVAPPVKAVDILNYYFRMQKAERSLNEVRLMLVGRGAAGKTSLVRRLVHGTFHPKQAETPGIEQTDWTMHGCAGEPVTAHVWDFAGQVITHSMHKYFLSHRTVYVLVLTQREDAAAEDAEYWLKLIRSYGTEDGETAPVLVALNKWDAAAVRVDRGRLQEQYPFIREFVETDCESGRGIAELKAAICNLMDAPRIQPWVRLGYPQQWWAVKEAIRKLQITQPHLSYHAWRKLCEENGVTDQNEQDTVSRILHTLGVALNYGEDPRLQDNTVLSPNWVTLHCYNLIRHAEKHGGELRRAELASVLGAEPKGEHDPQMHFYLMRLMERFEVAYPLGEEWPPERWLVPLALPDSQPAGMEVFGKTPPEAAVRLKYFYPSVPPGLVAQFIVRTHPLMEAKMQWANGTVLTLNGARALVRAVSKTEVEITAIGDDPAARRDLAGLCREELRGLNAQVSGLDVKERTEVVAEGEVVWVNVKTLEADELKGKKMSGVETDQGSVEVDTKKELDEFGTREGRWPEQLSPYETFQLLKGRYFNGQPPHFANPKPTVFISYSHADERLKKVLDLHLIVLKNLGLIHSTWHDRRIQPGMDWDKRIQEELAAADVVLFLTSTASLASGYINEDELRPALERHVKGEAHIVPIILERCLWVDTFAASKPLKNLPDPTRRVPQALPPDGKPIRSFNPQSGGWEEVAKGLKTLLTEVKAKLGKTRG